MTAAARRFSEDREFYAVSRCAQHPAPSRKPIDPAEQAKKAAVLAQILKESEAK